MILITGGTGYIGSHIAVELLEAGEKVVLVDNLSNSSKRVVDRIQSLTGEKVEFVQGDIDQPGTMGYALENFGKIDTVIHLAGFKSVAEAVKMPMKYYENNVVNTIKMLKVMKQHDVKEIIFSSSATVYGSPSTMPITEATPKNPLNAYAASKSMVEDILRDLVNTEDFWNVGVLRYFNPVGAHPSGMIGEVPNGVPNNLMPYMTQTAMGMRGELSVYGKDYDTADGTAVRDYIHVVDLARAHLSLLRRMRETIGYRVYNIGTGKGTSVQEMVDAFCQNAEPIRYRYEDRRPGDVEICFADCTKAQNELKWEPLYGIEEMCRDSYNFQMKNKGGI